MYIGLGTADRTVNLVHKQLPDEVPSNISADTIDSLLHTAILAEYNVKLDLVRGKNDSPLLPVRDQPLNEVERAKIQELVIANKALLAPLSEDGPLSVSNAFLLRENISYKRSSFWKWDLIDHWMNSITTILMIQR